MFFEAFSVSFSKTFFNCAGCTVNEFFSFFKTKTGEFFHQFNNSEFRSAGSFEDYVERRFFFNSGTCGSRTCSNSNCSSSGFDTVFFFEDLSEFVNFFNGEVYELFCKSF